MQSFKWSFPIYRYQEIYNFGQRVYIPPNCICGCRSSRPEVFCRKGVLRNFAKFTGKSLRPTTLLKKRHWHRCFPVNFSKFLRTPFFIEHLRWLLLKLARLGFPGLVAIVKPLWKLGFNTLVKKMRKFEKSGFK